MKLYLVRHGQTDWNLEHKAQGQTDIPLNDTGIKQATALREKLESYDFNICYASPLTRAAQTAKIALGNRNVKIIFDDNLKERYFGKLEGTNPNTWTLDNLDRRTNIDQDGIEPIKTLLSRSKQFLDRIKSENPKNAKILIVGHGTSLKALHFNIIGYDDDTDFWSFTLSNGEIAEYDI